MSTFRIILLGVFAVFIVAGVLIFSGIIPARGPAAEGLSGNVVIWGTLPRSAMSPALDSINRRFRELNVTYRQIEPAKFDVELLEALAVGVGPDLLLLPQDLVLRHQDKDFPIPYDSFPQRTFRDTFIAEAELYLSPQGVLGLPISIDPLVMYWNRTLLTNAGIAGPPEFWDEIFSLAPVLTQKDPGGNIIESTVSFGEFDNVTGAKDIIALLIIQAGNPIVARSGERFSSTLSSSMGLPQNPAEAAIGFYTEFSNPTSAVYSWNRSLPPSRQAFIAGDLAFYIGRASELFEIRERNPNLDFDVVSVPQTRGTATKTTLGIMNALSITRVSRNSRGAFAVANILSGRELSSQLAGDLALPPARRDLLAVAPPGFYLPVFYRAALQARGWLDPHPEKTDEIFSEMISNITSGRFDVDSAIGKASGEIGLLLK